MGNQLTAQGHHAKMEIRLTVNEITGYMHQLAQECR
jgi:hypothetical protein